MADVMSNVKPQCGGGGSNAEKYDLPLHVVALFLVLGFSCAGAGFPVVAKRVSWVRIPPSIFFACKHFGTGVLVATAFVHLIPTAFQSLNNPCLPDLLTDKYPAMPGVIMMFALFSLFLIEVYLKGKTGGHSHGGPTGQAPAQIHHTHNPNLRTMSTDSFNSIANLKSNSYPNEKEIGLARSYPADDYEREEYNDIKQYGSEAEMPPWFQVFFAQYVRQREELKIAISDISARNQSPAPAYRTQNTEKALELSDPTIDAATYRRMNLNITLFEGGILFHSVFVGMTVSITTDGFIILLIAILFHQFFEGLGLGSRIAAVPYPKGAAKPWVLVFAFGTTAPIGMAIGLITRNTYDPSSAFALILVGAFNAFSSGLLLYAATVDLLAEDFLSEEAQLLMTKQMKIKAFTYIMMGAAGMSIVGAFA